MKQNKQEASKGRVVVNKKLILSMVGLTVIALLIILWFYNANTPAKFEEKKLAKEEIFTDFSVNTFNSDVELQLLKELKICDTTRSSDQFGACSPKFFRFFKLNKDKPLRDGFMLLINGIAFQDPEAKFPIRRLLIFEREGGKLVAVNKFKGNLIETREVKDSPYSDILIRFKLDQYNEKYHVLYTWNKNRYQLKQCEKLVYWDESQMRFVGGRVMASKIDSVSREVEKILKEESLVF
ncbi:MAG: hypothetical protein ACKO4Y_04815 [Flavobacteriales bacterium]